MRATPRTNITASTSTSTQPALLGKQVVKMQVKHEKRKKSQISKILKLFQKIFICHQKNKKVPKRYISYASIEIQGLKRPEESKRDVDWHPAFCEESSSRSKQKSRNPESATLSSQNALPGLVPALLQFRKRTAESR